MSNIIEKQETKKIPQPLSKETWNNEPKPEPFNEKTKPFLQQFVADVGSMGASDELNFSSGDSIELKFYMDDPQTGPRTKSMPKWDKTGNMVLDTETGKPVKEEQIKPNFVVYNHRDKVKQNWWIAAKWARLAAETMMEYNTDTLQVKRIGKTAGDTVYTFMPTGLKRAG